MKRIKIIRLLATYICHDAFPPMIYRERERILPVLRAWEHKGYLTLVYDDTTAFVLNVEKLPSKERLIEESRNVK